jgi:hypothetical protein
MMVTYRQPGANCPAVSAFGRQHMIAKQQDVGFSAGMLGSR